MSKKKPSKPSDVPSKPMVESPNKEEEAKSRPLDPSVSSSVDKASLAEESDLAQKINQSDQKEKIDEKTEKTKLKEPAQKAKESIAENEIVPSSTKVIENKKATKKSVVILVLLIMLWLIVFSAIGGLAYGGYIIWHKQESVNTQVNTQVNGWNNEKREIEQQLQSALATIQGVERNQYQYSESQRAKISLFENKISNNERRLSAQQKRLSAMSTTSSEDWLLAEAEYLLRLGGQRILIEGDVDNTIALFEQADAILRDLADPDLFPIREEIKKDLIELKLIQKIDVEGIYLDLSALIHTIESIPLNPEPFNYKVEETTEKTISEEATNALENFINSIKKYVRIVDHTKKIEAIIPPEWSNYLHLNLRILIEKSQLALLQKRSKLYKHTIKEAILLIEKNFPSTQYSQQYITQLQALEKKKIETQLPEVDDSVKLIQSYISDLHKLKSLNISTSNGAEK